MRKRDGAEGKWLETLTEPREYQEREREREREREIGGVNKLVMMWPDDVAMMMWHGDDVTIMMWYL